MYVTPFANREADLYENTENIASIFFDRIDFDELFFQ